MAGSKPIELFFAWAKRPRKCDYVSQRLLRESDGLLKAYGQIPWGGTEIGAEAQKTQTGRGL